MIILSIPFINAAFVKQTAKKYDCEYREYRLDYHEELRFFPTELIDEKTILTIRSPLEGGKNHFKELEKLNFLRQMVQRFNCLIDIEYYYFQKFPSSLFPSENTIISYHDFSEITSLQKLRSLSRKIDKLQIAYFKIAVNIPNFEFLTAIQDLIRNSSQKILWAGLGKFGKLSRLIYRQIGVSGTYIGLDENLTATGQLKISEAKKFELDRINEQTKIGGIIGGKQVLSSLGIKFYNDYFRKAGINAIYLPIYLDSIDNFKKWLLSKKNIFFGFSVTMPCKKQFSDMFNELEITNLLLPFSKRSKNTDSFAFQYSLKFLQVKKEDQVLILGTGATAETALVSLQNFPHVFITGRNFTKGKLLARKFDRKFIEQTTKFDLLINCTPLLFYEDNIFSKLNLPLPKKYLELPYSEKISGTIQKCKKENIIFVDGKKFWKWQAKMQLENFLTEIEKIEKNEYS